MQQCLIFPLGLDQTNHTVGSIIFYNNARDSLALSLFINHDAVRQVNKAWVGIGP